jgi:uncharacterized protein
MPEQRLAFDAVPAADAVTVVITRRVGPGREIDYEAWLKRLQHGAHTAPGYLGATTQRPAPGGPAEYFSVVRFASLADLRQFESSELHRRALVEVAPWLEGHAVWQHLTGLEFWFTPPPGTVVPQPSRERMVLLLITIALEVPLLTYVVMPRLTRRLAHWIYPNTPKSA